MERTDCTLWERSWEAGSQGYCLPYLKNRLSQSAWRIPLKRRLNQWFGRGPRPRGPYKLPGEATAAGPPLRSTKLWHGSAEKKTNWGKGTIFRTRAPGSTEGTLRRGAPLCPWAQTASDVPRAPPLLHPRPHPLPGKTASRKRWTSETSAGQFPPAPPLFLTVPLPPPPAPPRRRPHPLPAGRLPGSAGPPRGAPARGPPPAPPLFLLPVPPLRLPLRSFLLLPALPLLLRPRPSSRSRDFPFCDPRRRKETETEAQLSGKREIGEERLSVIPRGSPEDPVCRIRACPWTHHSFISSF